MTLKIHLPKLVDTAEIHRAFSAARRAAAAAALDLKMWRSTSLEPRPRSTVLPARPALPFGPRFGPPPPPSPPVKVPRRSTHLVKAEQACRDYDYVAKFHPHLIPTKWSKPTIIADVASVDELEETAKERNARLRRNYRDRQRYKTSISQAERRRRKVLKANRAAGKDGTKGWRSRELRRKADAAKSLTT